MSDRSRDSLTGLVPETNQAPNQFYDKNLGRAYDRFNSQYRHAKRLKEIQESDRSVKSRLSSGSTGRSGVNVGHKLL